MFSVAVAGVIILTLLGAVPLISDRSIDFSSLSKLKNIRIYMLALVFFTLIGSLISVSILLVSDEFSFFLIALRLFSQYGALFVNMIIIVCGYHLSTYFSNRSIRKAIYIPFVITLSICVYQSFADSLGLPFIGKYEMDKFVGLRPSGLANEPKYLASYLVVVFFFLLYEFGGKDNRSNKLVVFVRLIGLVVSGYFFLAASSGNGILALCILLVFSFTRLRIHQQLLTSVFFAAFLIWLSWFIESESFVLRGSHKDIIDNFFNLDLTYFDDLIALPVMAWRDNFWNLLIGFGPGLMHFFAYRYMNFATWFTDETYIEGNVSAITFISNFGLIIFLFLFAYFTKCCLASLNNKTLIESRSINFFFATSFFVGALVQGNMSIPFYLALGWILHKRVQVNLFSINKLVQAAS